MSALESVSLWIGFAGMLFGVLAFAVLRFRKATPTSRSFYDKSILIVLIATCAYLAMALGLGDIGLAGGHRVLVPRYIDWIFTTPLLLLDLILFAKPLLAEGWEWDAVTVVGFDVVMIVTGIVSALTEPPVRWVWFWVSTVAYVVVALRVLDLVRRSRSMPDARVGGKLRTLALYLSAFWLVYPFVFALYFGGVIGSGTEDLVFMLLDIGAKVGFGFVLLLGPAVELVDRLPSVAQRRTHDERSPRDTQLPVESM